MTTTGRDEERIVPVREMPHTRAAQDRLSALQTERTAIEAQIARGRAQVDEIARAEAAIAEPPLLLERAKLDLAIGKATQSLEQTREDDRVEIHQRADRLKGPLVQRLAPILDQAVSINERLAAIELAEHDATGDFLDPVHWPSLTRWAAHGWNANVRARALLD